MLEKVLEELQREGIKALEYADDFLRKARKADDVGDSKQAEMLRLSCHAHRDTASSLAWVYSRTMTGACAADIVNLWDRIRSSKTNCELAKLCGVGLREED